MSRSAAGKSTVTSDVYSGSETAARLADYSGQQYYYISGRSTVVAELSEESAAPLSDVSGVALMPVSMESGSDKDPVTSKDHKTDNPGKDPAKVSLL